MARVAYLVLMLFLFSSIGLCANNIGSGSSGLKGVRKVYMPFYERISDPALGTSTYISANITLATANVNDITPASNGLTSIDVSRKVIVTLGGTAASVAANGTTNVTSIFYNRNSTVVASSYWILGTDINGNYIGESLGFSENTAGSVTTTYAYKTIVEIHTPAMDGAGVTMSIGVTDALGYKGQLDDKVQLLNIYVGGSKEATWPTITTSSVIAGNTIDPNTALDGSKHVDIVYLTDFY